jgi:hypothetical protein
MKKRETTNRDYKGRFAVKRGGFKLILSLIVALLLALAFVRLSIWVSENFMWDGKFKSPIPEARAIEVKTVENKKTDKLVVMQMIKDEFAEFGSAVVIQALNVAYCESRFDETAEHVNRNGSADRGVFQISSIHGYSEYKLFAAWENINIAREIYRKQGWRPWACARKLGYVK